MEDSISTPANVLRLDSIHNTLDDPFASWDNRRNATTGQAALPMATPLDLGLGLPGTDVNAFQSDLDYQVDAGLLDSMTTIPFTPSYDIDSFTNFDDPFSFQPESYNVPPAARESKPMSVTPASTSSREEKPDNKLLSFKPPISNYALFTSTGQQTWPSMTAELYGMFFVAEDVFGEPAQPPGRLTELTCYRRNLFQISGNIIMSRDIKTVVTEAGVQMPIYNLGVTLTAVDSAEGKATDIISVPWKPAGQTAATPGFLVEDKAGTNPQKISLDLNTHPELDPAVMSLPIAWKRLQFKHATANNGRRKGLQQNYVAHICLTGTLANGEELKLVEIHSGPIIVRGRSPRNFDTRKDVSLNAKQPLYQTKLPEFSKDFPVKVDPGVSNGHGQFYGQNTVQQPLDLADWKTSANPSSSLPNYDSHVPKKPTLTHNNSFSSTTRPPLPQTKWRSDSVSTQAAGIQQRTMPIDLAMVEGLPHKTRTSSSSGPRTLTLGESSPVFKRRESIYARSGSVDDSKGEKKSVGSPVENADLLYEYFPLSLDDWMPPVDAIYRPHVVHHTVIPPDYKDELKKIKTKRYFSAED